MKKLKHWTYSMKPYDELTEEQKVCKLVKYACPSTDRVYVDFVPEHFVDADEAMAWKHNYVSKEAYLADKVES